MAIIFGGKPYLSVESESGGWIVQNTQGSIRTWFCDISECWFDNYRSDHPLKELVFSENLSDALVFSSKENAKGIIQQAMRYKTTVIFNKIKPERCSDIIRRIHEQSTADKGPGKAERDP